jgi:folate-dependent phosphoribosylglycinamide formyltransferase PurN/peptidoglycan/xylan/chitin deacetylase (PgdA/CDA1 family)
MDGDRLRVVVFTAGPLVPVNQVLFERLAGEPLIDLRGIIVDEYRRPSKPLVLRVGRSLSREGLPWLWFKIVSRLQSLVRRAAVWIFERSHPPAERPSYDRWARHAGIPVHRVADIHADSSVALVRSLQPQLGVIVGGRILRESVISIPSLGTLNIHKRKVPQYRGGGPVGYWEILAGEPSIGVTIHYATADVDAGRVLTETEVPIEECDTLESLAIKADVVGGRLYHDTIRQFAQGRRLGTPQDPASARVYRSPSELAVWRLERRLKRKAARLMPLLRDRPSSSMARARVLLQYVFLMPWLLRRRRTLITQRTAPIGIFFYHVVGNDPINHMCLPLEAFVRQIEFLRGYYPVLSLDEAVDRVRSGQNDQLAAAITFDDGYDENKWAIEYLRYFGVPATFFVSMGHVRDGTGFEHDLRRGFDRARPMPEPEVSRLADEGFVVGSHGIYHEDFGALDTTSADRVLRESRERVARVCGRAPEYFSFPKGQRAINITADTYALATKHYRCVFSAYGGHNFPSEGRQHFVRLPNRVDVPELAMTMDGYVGLRECVAGNAWGLKSYALAPY